jgi:cell wall-associated NlpC family hydrolase
MKLSARIYADLVGKPFVEGGRGPYGYDCLGLALELQRRQGRPVDDYASTMDEFTRAYSGGVFGPCMRLEAAEAGCVVLLRTGINRRHVGTMLDNFTMLHTMEDLKRSAIERILAPEWTRRIIGFYRPEVQA